MDPLTISVLLGIVAAMTTISGVLINVVSTQRIADGTEETKRRELAIRADELELAKKRLALDQRLQEMEELKQRQVADKDRVRLAPSSDEAMDQLEEKKPILRLPRGHDGR